MEYGTLLQAITTVGFPIVMCGVMAWYVKYITDKNREEIDELNKQHDDELSGITVAINNNTIALTKLCERLGMEGDTK